MGSTARNSRELNTPGPSTPDGSVLPALYEAEVGHCRLSPLRREFTSRLYLWLVDLDHPPELPWWLRPFAGFRAADHLGRPDQSIRRNVEDFLATHGIDLRGGRVLMLAHLRVLGHVFNPLTLYWCHHADGTQAAVIAEVHNTYGQRHCYLLRPDADGRASTPKEFYVSPFLTVDGRYDLVVPVPGERLGVAVALRQHGTTPFTATLHGRRVPADAAHLTRMLLRYPGTPQRVSLAIRRHGIALWARGLPIVPRTGPDGKPPPGQPQHGGTVGHPPHPQEHST